MKNYVYNFWVRRFIYKILFNKNKINTINLKVPYRYHILLLSIPIDFGRIYFSIEWNWKRFPSSIHLNVIKVVI